MKVSDYRLRKIYYLKQAILDLQNRLRDITSGVTIKPGKHLGGKIIVRDIPARRVRSHLRRGHRQITSLR